MTYLLQVSTCWIVFYGIYLLFLQKETFFTINRYYLVGALIIGLAIPYIGAFFPANQTSTEIYQAMTQVTAVEITYSPEKETTLFTWTNFFYLIYGLGAMVVCARFFYGLSRIYGIYKDGYKTKYEKYTLVESTRFHLPFSFFHYIFISKELPLDKDVEKVMRHEELHAHQWHSLDIVFTEILQIFFWFNPILIFYRSSLKQSHEYLADAYVTRDHNRNSYGQLLLRQSTSGLEIALANHFFHSQIKKRITMMYKEKSKRPAMVKYLTAIPVLIGLVVLFASNRASDALDKAAANDCINLSISAEGKIYLDQKEVALQTLTNQFENAVQDCATLQVETATDVVDIVPILKAASQNDIEVKLTEKVEKALIEFKQAQTTESQLSDGRKNIQHFAQPVYETWKGDEKGTAAVLDKAAANGEQVDPIFKVVEEMPRFPGCEDRKGSTAERDRCAKEKMLQYIYQNLKYPEDAKKNNVQGVSVIQFVIEKDGSISNGTIVKDPGSGTGAESLRVVNSMPKWIPGKQKGKKVRVKYTLPIKYKMADEEEEIVEETIKVKAEGKISKKAIEENLVISDYKEKEIPYKVVEQMPRFAGCDDENLTEEEKQICSKKKMIEFIASNLKYPKEAKEKGIAGVAVIQLVIEKDGSISSSEIVRDPGAGTGTEAKRVVDSMPNWTPGKQGGKEVRVEYILPIKYALEEKKNLEQDVEEKIMEKIHYESKMSKKKVESLPLFPGTNTHEESSEKMLNFVFQNVSYPKEAARNNIEGIAVVKFVVNPQGKIENVRLAKSLGWKIDEVVLALMEKMKDLDAPWTPATVGDTKVKYEYVLPIKFKLQDDQIEEAKSRKLAVEQINIRPNPSDGMVNLTFNIKDKTPADVVFYSITGQVLKTLNNVSVPFEQTIDLTEYKGQTIFINIIQKDKVHTDKVVIH